MSFATTMMNSTIPVARSFTASKGVRSVGRPAAIGRSRAPLTVRAGDPAAPDKTEVKDEVIDCKCRLLLCPSSRCCNCIGLLACILSPHPFAALVVLRAQQVVHISRIQPAFHHRRISFKQFSSLVCDVVQTPGSCPASPSHSPTSLTL